MKKIFSVLSLIILGFIAKAQNVGINNTDPKTALDINGGFSTRTKVAIPSGNAVNIPANASFVIVSGGAATGTISCLYPSPYIDGQRMVIYNSNSGGYDLDFLGTKIPLNQGREFICSTLTGWALLSGALNSEGWGLRGNAGTDTSVNFIGTKDYMPLRFKFNNKNAGLLSQENTAFGYQAFNSVNSTSLLNTAIGHSSLGSFINGFGNIGLGSGALGVLKSGNTNIGIGFGSLALHNGNNNILISNTNNAGTKDTFLVDNVIIGNQLSATGLSLGSSKNVLIGNFAGGSYIFGGSNVAIGDSASTSNIYGQSNVAVGAKSMALNKNGNGAVAIGHQAAFSDTAAEGMVAIGRAALYNNNNNPNNLAIGDSALFNNGTGTPTPELAINNLAVGSKSLFNNTIGVANTATGFRALFSNSIGNFNTAIGERALVSNTEGGVNTAVGAKSLLVNQTGVGNVAIGSSALSNSTGNRNVAIGSQAALGINGGNFNTVIGSDDESVFTFRPISGSVFIGAKAGKYEPSSNKLYIENSAANKDNALIYGDFAADSLLLNAKTVVRNNAVVRGFTKLGGYSTDVPSIKMKKLTGVNGAAGTTTPFLHGLTQSKILSVSILINASTSNDIPPRSTYTGFEYDYYVSPTNIFIRNIVGNDGSITNRPVRILITYEE